MQSSLSIPGGAAVLGALELGVQHGTLPQPCQLLPTLLKCDCKCCTLVFTTVRQLGSKIMPYPNIRE